MNPHPQNDSNKKSNNRFGPGLFCKICLTDPFPRFPESTSPTQCSEWWNPGSGTVVDLGQVFYDLKLGLDMSGMNFFQLR